MDNYLVWIVQRETYLKYKKNNDDKKTLQITINAYFKFELFLYMQ